MYDYYTYSKISVLKNSTQRKSWWTTTHHNHFIQTVVKVKLSLYLTTTPWKCILCLIKHHVLKT